MINGYIYNSISDHRCLEIGAPSLQSLEILVSMDMKKCRLTNVSPLFHASLTFYMSSMYDYSESDEAADFARVEDLRNMVRDLMERVRHVQHITIGTWIVQVSLLLWCCYLAAKLIFADIISLHVEIMVRNCWYMWLGLWEFS